MTLNIILRAKKEDLVYQDHPGSKAIEGLMAYLACLGCQAKRASPVFQAEMVQKVQEDHRDHQGYDIFSVIPWQFNINFSFSKN